VIGWVERLPTGWLILVIFAGTLLLTIVIYYVVLRAAAGPSGPALKAISPGLLPPMALVFGLIVGFLVAGLWGDLNNARDAVNHEASALRSASLVASASFPGPTSMRVDALIDRQINEAATQEWPAMRDQRASLTAVPTALAQALQLALRIDPVNQSQVTAQRELVSSLQNALDARRQRIIVSEGTINWVKWLAVIALGALTLIAVACVHADNRRTAAIAMAIFGSAIAVTFLLMASQALPFNGEFGVKPDALLQVAPSATAPG
jgi:cytochrome bd-type quinol oxidase subunit 2